MKRFTWILPVIGFIFGGCLYWSGVWFAYLGIDLHSMEPHERGLHFVESFLTGLAFCIVVLGVKK